MTDQLKNQLKEIFIMPGANLDEDRKIFA